LKASEKEKMIHKKMNIEENGIFSKKKEGNTNIYKIRK